VITSQTALFLEYYRKHTIGVTGTKGKSTTVSMIHHILNKAGKLDERERAVMNAHPVEGARLIITEEPELDMAAVVVEALDRLADMIAGHQAEIITPEVWPAALGYGPWVEEIWVNYVSNGLKYGGQPPQVEMGGKLLNEPAGQVRFWVRDNGAGLSPDDQARLFIPFTQIHQARAEGHGLGLSIVQRIVEKLGGQVGVESEAGQGSVFFFTLPQSKTSS